MRVMVNIKTVLLPCLLNQIVSHYPLVDDDEDGVINAKELGTFLRVQNLISKLPSDATMICLAEQLSACPASKEGPFISFEALIVYTTEGTSGCMLCEAYPEQLKP